jgi:hypothetical protein
MVGWFRDDFLLWFVVMSDFVSVSARLARLHRLLGEAYSHYFRYEKKAIPDEGSVSVSWGDVRGVLKGDVEPSVVIVSSAFGDGDTHVFSTLDEALVEVEAWYSRELSNEPDTDVWFKEVDEWV